MTRTLVMGDPQAPMAQVMDVLRANGALGDDGRLAPDVVLISAGDHFDYDLNDPLTAGREGVRNLRWLASHPPSQVRILLGNHDASRVMELIGLDDARFGEARAMALTLREIYERDGAEAARDQRDAWFARFPDVPTPGLVGRDYASYSEAQRALVIELLLAGRFHLALAGELPDGREVLLSHAGVTMRELDLLGMPDERSPRRLASVLEARLRAAVDERRDDWARGALVPMSLEPLHVAGSPGAEGGGLLYHRPARPHRPGSDDAWERDAARPRRFDPRSLPAGLVQVVGHTGHHKAKSELGDAWLSDAARAHIRGGIRTLRVDGDDVRYDLGALTTDGDAAGLVLVDGEMSRVPADEYALLALTRVFAPD